VGYLTFVADDVAKFEGALYVCNHLSNAFQDRLLWMIRLACCLHQPHEVCGEKLCHETRNLFKVAEPDGVSHEFADRKLLSYKSNSEVMGQLDREIIQSDVIQKSFVARIN
jgi:hypothetical protein